MNEGIEPKETAHQSDAGVPESIASTKVCPLVGKDKQPLQPRVPRFEIDRQDDLWP